MKRVIIVDDEQLICSGLEQRITEYESGNIVSTTKQNGREAVNWLEHYYADICITDVQMPVMNGLELLRFINNTYPWMGCIVVSSYSDFNYIQNSIHLGAFDYILKPVKQDSLSIALKKVSKNLDASRTLAATHIVLKVLPSSSKIMDLWVERILSGQHLNIPMLIVETLEMLETWCAQQYYLLQYMAKAWIQLVIGELKSKNVEFALDGEDEHDYNFISDTLIPIEKMRFYFRLYAVGILETECWHIINTITGGRDPMYRSLVEQVKIYIQENYMKKISLQHLSQFIGISRTYLPNIFKQETGMNIWTYLHSVRMKHARMYLLEGSLKVYEIAEKVGYENQIYFSQIFKKHYGKNPAGYKKEYSNIR